MKLLINIPKEFEQHFQTDRFEDSLHRLSADAHLLAGNYEKETAVMLIEAFASAVPVPPHGRCVDADVFEKSLSTLLQFPSNLVNGQWIVNTIREQPTIIPAEEDGCGRCDHCRIPQTGTCRYGEEGET